MDRRTVILSAATLTLAATTSCLVTPAMARNGEKFTNAAFEAAQAAGKPILIDVSAPWCPTCKAQAPIIEFMLTDPALKDMVRLNVDFDSMKDTLRALNVRQQSTFIVFKGKKEIARSTGDTTPNGIEALLRKAI